MHNNSFQLYSHQQVGRLSPIFFFFFHKRNYSRLIFCSSHLTAVRKAGPYPTLANGDTLQLLSRTSTRSSRGGAGSYLPVKDTTADHFPPSF